MNKVQIYRRVSTAFPYCEKPNRSELSIHSEKCFHCKMSLEELDRHDGSKLPETAIRYLHNEMSTLSAKAISWVLPSYLRLVIENPEPGDPVPEFLIYFFAPVCKYETETKSQLEQLSTEQIDCLIDLMGYFNNTDWGSYCPDELESAVIFLQSLKQS